MLLFLPRWYIGTCISHSVLQRALWCGTYPLCKNIYNLPNKSTTCQKSPQQLPPGCKHCHHPLGSVPPTTAVRLVPHPRSTAPTCWLGKCCGNTLSEQQGFHPGWDFGSGKLSKAGGSSQQSPKFKVSFGIFAHWETWQGSTKRSTATEWAKDSLRSVWSAWSCRTLELLAAWWPMTTSASQQAWDVSALGLQCFHSFRFTRSATEVFSYLITFSTVLQTYKVLIEAQNCTFTTKRGLFIFFYFLSS